MTKQRIPEVKESIGKYGKESQTTRRVLLLSSMRTSWTQSRHVINWTASTFKIDILLVSSTHYAILDCAIPPNRFSSSLPPAREDGKIKRGPRWEAGKLGTTQEATRDRLILVVLGSGGAPSKWWIVRDQSSTGAAEDNFGFRWWTNSAEGSRRIWL